VAGVADRAMDLLDTLAHGNQQRVQLIAALVNEPDLLVLDEPFSGLDPIAMGAMAALLADLAAAGATVLFSSHQLDLCQDVVIIDQGRIVLSCELADCEPRCRNGSSRSATAGQPRTGRAWRRWRSWRRTTARPGCGSIATPI
jgi:ABC-type uncharacterized transport system ATPase subunit